MENNIDGNELDIIKEAVDTIVSIYLEYARACGVADEETEMGIRVDMALYIIKICMMDGKLDDDEIETIDYIMGVDLRNADNIDSGADKYIKMADEKYNMDKVFAPTATFNIAISIDESASKGIIDLKGQYLTIALIDTYKILGRTFSNMKSDMMIMKKAFVHDYTYRMENYACRKIPGLRYEIERAKIIEEKRNSEKSGYANDESVNGSVNGSINDSANDSVNENTFAGSGGEISDLMLKLVKEILNQNIESEEEKKDYKKDGSAGENSDGRSSLDDAVNGDSGNESNGTLDNGKNRTLDDKKTDSKDDKDSETEKEDPRTLEELMDELNSLVGLEAVKKDITNLIHLQEVRKMRRERGMADVPMSNHLVFYGNPGTGKTTVARLLSKIYNKMGLLSKGQLVEVDRSGLVAGYVGQTAIKTKEAIDKAMGGILFIDEAYTLSYAGNENDFGREAIDTILKAMEDNRDDFIVIVAGYTNLMAQFIDSNPGLKSRFNKYISFEDYTNEELLLIFDVMCKKSGYVVSDEARVILPEVFDEVFTDRDENFANAREVRNFFEKVIIKQANRLYEMENPSDDDLVTIIKDDLKEDEKEKEEDEQVAENNKDE